VHTNPVPSAAWAVRRLQCRPPPPAPSRRSVRPPPGPLPGARVAAARRPPPAGRLAPNFM